MCQKVKRILIKRSREASRRYGGVYVVTVCPHDVRSYWRLGTGGPGFSKFGENAWKTYPFTLWPDEIRDFVNNGLNPPPRAASADPDRCICGRKKDGLYLCRRCESSGESQIKKIGQHVPTRREKNEAKARERLKAWQKKLKLAQTKVKQYARKVRYYERCAK